MQILLFRAILWGVVICQRFSVPISWQKRSGYRLQELLRTVLLIYQGRSANFMQKNLFLQNLKYIFGEYFFGDWC